METLEYKPRLAQKPVHSLGGLEFDLSSLEAVENPNVRRVALMARDVRERLKSDSSYEVQGTYSEAYSGELA